GTAAIAQGATAIDHLDLGAALGEFQRADQARDASANDGDRMSFHSTNSRSFAGMIRIRFKGFSRSAVSARPPCGDRTPLGRHREKGIEGPYVKVRSRPLCCIAIARRTAIGSLLE